jgi:hypothetical protein
MSSACTSTASPKTRKRVAVCSLGVAAALSYMIAAACLKCSAVVRITAAVRARSRHASVMSSVCCPAGQPGQVARPAQRRPTLRDRSARITPARLIDSLTAHRKDR